MATKNKKERRFITKLTIDDCYCIADNVENINLWC
jgi:hypothetical protein